MFSRSIQFTLGCSLLVIGCLTAPAAARVYPTYWQDDPASQGDWFDPANWTLGVPTETSPTYVDNGGTVIIRGLDVLAAAQYLNLDWGTADQFEGTLKLARELHLGGRTLSGFYNLLGGRLTCGSLSVRSKTTLPAANTLTDVPPLSSRFRQTAGINEIGDTLWVGQSWNVIIPFDAPAWGPIDQPSMIGVNQDYLSQPGSLYELDGGELVAGRAYVGDTGKGTIHQTGGASTFTKGLHVGGVLYIPPVVNGSSLPTITSPSTYTAYYAEGVYVLDGGTLRASSVSVGEWGRGSMIQNGGAAQVDGILEVSGVGPSTPEPFYYAMNASAVANTTQLVRPATDTANWTHGGYVLNDGSLCTNTTKVGLGGSGDFIQNGGDHNVAQTLDVGYAKVMLSPIGPFDGSAASAGGSITPTVQPMPVQIKWPHGSYVLNGGVLSTGATNVGVDGPGVFIQNGGLHNVSGTLEVGWALTMPIQAQPLDGAVVSATDSITPTEVWMPVSETWSHGNYVLNGGVLSTGATIIADGVGDFLQNGGVHKVAGALQAGAPPARDILVLSPGSNGQFIAAPPAAGNQIIHAGPCDGRYTLAGGELYAGSLEVGPGYTSPQPGATATSAVPLRLLQTGGRAAITGDVNVIASLYELRGGRVTGNSLSITGARSSDASEFRQTGGYCKVENIVSIDGLPRSVLGPLVPEIYPTLDPVPVVAGPKTLSLEAGTLEAGSVDIGGPEASLLQTGGTLRVHKGLQASGLGATYTIEGGTLDAGEVAIGIFFRPSPLRPSPDCPPNLGTVLVQGTVGMAPTSWVRVKSAKADITINSRLTFGSDAGFAAVRGSSIHMAGADLKNYSTNPSSLAGLDNLRMVFTTGQLAVTDAIVWNTFEVAGNDLGPVRKGFFNNFALQTLQLGDQGIGRLKLADDFVNQPGAGGHEALYVRNLVIGAGSQLDLAGLDLYYLNLVNLGGTIDLGGGSLTQVPTPLWWGDFNRDGRVTAADVDLLQAAVRGGTMAAVGADFDLNGDGVVNRLDAAELLDNVLRVSPADTNLDGVVNLRDLISLAGRYGRPGGFADGDTDGNGVIDLIDLANMAKDYANNLPGNGGNPAVVPEPASLSILALAGMALSRRRRA